MGSSVHYPSPLHRQAPIAPYLESVPELPVAEAAAEEVLSLPMFPELTDAEFEETAAAVRSFFERGAPGS